MNLKDKAIKIQGKDYVQVKDRVLYLAEQIKDYSIETDYIYYPEQKMWVVKAKLTIGSNTYTGLGQEVESENYKDVNFSSALENCETSAVGRACAMAGIGVIDSIASSDEMNKASNRSFSSTFAKTARKEEAAGDLKCSDCKKDITPAEASYSLSKFGIKLCRGCQPGATTQSFKN